jgi:hypothetical protein
MPHFEATAYFKSAICSARAQRGEQRRTKNLVADVMLSNEVAEKLFVDTSLVDDLQSMLVSHPHFSSSGIYMCV